MGRSTLLITLLLAASNSLIAQHASVRVQIVDRGQADGILIRTPNDQCVVIDGGGRDHRMVNAMENVWGVDEVALLIVSHRHGDHHGGVPPILQSDTSAPTGTALASTAIGCSPSAMRCSR